MESRISSLVIGYGNTLRSDDGVGQVVAETIADWQLQGVRSLAVHQLTPELAADIATVQQVIFVDAIAAEADSTVQVQRLAADASSQLGGHYQSPRSLLRLAHQLYAAAPIAYQILIPAVNFDFGEALSPLTEAATATALEKIRLLLTARTV